MVSTLAGSGAGSWVDGVGTAAGLNRPGGVVVSSDGTVFVSDGWNNRIRSILTSGESGHLNSRYCGLKLKSTHHSFMCRHVDI